MIIRMIIEAIRKHIKSCGKTRYRIAQETGVGEDQLCLISITPQGMVENNKLKLKKKRLHKDN